MLLEVSNDTSLYHRSPIKLKVGDKIVKPKTKDGKNWMASKPFELAMEAERKQYFPDKPSRMDCVYSSLVPRSRFIDKGYLYRIKPTGRIHITDSTWLDKSADEFERRTSHYYGEDYQRFLKGIAEQPEAYTHYLPPAATYYWEGATPTRENIKDIEVLSDGAVVVEEIEETGKSKPIMPGDQYKVTKDNKLIAHLDLYINSKYEKGQPNLSQESIDNLIYLIENVIFTKRVKIKKTEDNITFQGMLKKGAKLRVIQARHAILFGRQQAEKGKYNLLMVEFFLPNVGWIYRPSEKNQANLSHRFTIALYTYKYADDGTKMVYDFTKYLKPL